MFYSLLGLAQNGGAGMESVQVTQKDALSEGSGSAAGQNLEGQILKESEVVDFDSVKDLLKKDQLEKEVSKIEKVVKTEKKKKVDVKKNLYNIPGDDEFWSFFSEYWLVKNAPALKWEYQHPEYGLEETFEKLLEKFGHFEKKFKILLLNTTALYHIALPSDSSGVILLLSDPFIKHLDLSKLEIALLMLQDFLRERMGQFKRKVETKELRQEIGRNFEGRPLSSKIFDQVLKNYDQVIFNKGFTFQEQFELTRDMGNLLRSETTLWTTYVELLKKLDGIVKTDNKFKEYSKIYPSPELQINWLGIKTGPR
ncbi:MAG: hypothetical protein A2X86_06630 [Bdellovibrionales bacterium GWA2_49_15]|nr:MAG: hypothetical protein A2X86_06630 [Bdellovibrionales bacterium GWA2_49_15]HAZ12052.1 hypothetical protein [Bdellovibrionales bacterium]